MVQNPLLKGERKRKFRKFRRISIIMIWIISFLLPTVPLIASFLQLREFYMVSRLFNLNCFGTFPIIAITSMYCILIWKIKSKQSEKKRITGGKSLISEKESSEERMVAVVRRLIIVLLICYVLYLVYKEYAYGIITNRPDHKLYIEVKYMGFTYHRPYLYT